MAKIMLVEDDNNLREIYEARLLAEGYEVVGAQDGEEALAVAVKEKPDLIISDVMMPKISGFDMLDILRSTPETKETKVIMMTALSQAEDKARADKLGADRYLVKSQVTLEDVARVAREVLEGEGAAAAGDATSTAPATSAPTASADAPTTEPASPATPPADEPTQAPANGSPSPDDSPADQPSDQPVAAAPTSIPVMSPADEPTEDSAGGANDSGTPAVTDPTAPAAADDSASSTPAADPAVSADATSTGDVVAAEPQTSKEETTQLEEKIASFVEQAPTETPEAVPAADSPAPAATSGGQSTSATLSPAASASPPVPANDSEATATETDGPVLAKPAGSLGRVIQPSEDFDTKPDLNKLLAEEEAKEILKGNQAAPAAPAADTPSPEAAVSETSDKDAESQQTDKDDPNQIAL